MGSSRPDRPNVRDTINHNSTPKTPRTRAQNKVFHPATIRRLPRDNVEPGDSDNGSGNSGQHSDTTSRAAAIQGTAKRSRANDGTTRIPAGSRRKPTRGTTKNEQPTLTVKPQQQQRAKATNMHQAPHGATKSDRKTPSRGRHNKKFHRQQNQTHTRHHRDERTEPPAMTQRRQEARATEAHQVRDAD